MMERNEKTVNCVNYYEQYVFFFRGLFICQSNSHFEFITFCTAAAIRLLMTWHICVQTTRITNTRECARVHTIQQHKKELRQLLNVVDMNKN